MLPFYRRGTSFQAIQLYSFVKEIALKMDVLWGQVSVSKITRGVL